MKYTIFTCVVFLFTTSAWSQDFYCDIIYNNQVILTNKVTLGDKNQKVLIGKSDAVTGYITLSDKNLYTIEAFLPEYEARIYGQGALNTASDSVTASIWGRESMIDVTCRIVK